MHLDEKQGRKPCTPEEKVTAAKEWGEISSPQEGQKPLQTQLSYIQEHDKITFWVPVEMGIGYTDLPGRVGCRLKN